jgi:hypothetical protein
MKLAHNIGTYNHPNYNTCEEILACNEPIGFDGIYLNVYENQDVLKDKSGIMFVMGDFMGGDNHFDLAHVPALEKYCTWEQVYELCAKYDFKIGWHTWSHRDLTKLTRDEILEEVTPPFPMQFFAYPYGTYNDLVIECVKEVGFKVAYSVTQGSQDRTDPDYHFKIYRDYIR